MGGAGSLSPKSPVGQAVLETAPCGQLLRGWSVYLHVWPKACSDLSNYDLVRKIDSFLQPHLDRKCVDPEGQAASRAAPFLALPHAHLRKLRERGCTKAGISTGAVTDRKMQMKTTGKCLFHPRGGQRKQVWPAWIGEGFESGPTP